MVASTVVLDRTARSSTFSYTIGSTTRELSYEGGRVTLPALTVPTVFSLADFTWLHSEVKHWISTVQEALNPPALPAALLQVTFTLGVYHAPSQTYAASMGLWFSDLSGATTTFNFNQSQGTVTLAARPAFVIAWTSLEAINEHNGQLLSAVTTGKRFE